MGGFTDPPFMLRAGGPALHIAVDTGPPAHRPPVYADISGGDVSALIGYLFITGLSPGLPDYL